VALNTVFTDLATKIASDYAAGAATRMNIGTKGVAFGWTGGMPRTIAEYVPTAQVAGMSVPVGQVTLSASTPPAVVTPGSPKPTSVDLAIAPVALQKFAGKGVCTLEGTLEAAGLIPAITSVLGAGCLLAYEAAAIAALDGVTGGESATAASWTEAILAGQADVLANGGSPGLIVVSSADFAAIVTDLGAKAGFTLDPKSPVGSFFGSAIHVSPKAAAGKAWVLDPYAVLALENESSPFVTIDPFSLSGNNQIQLVADVIAGLAIVNPKLISEVTKS
jgi:hypothetical protein